MPSVMGRVSPRFIPYSSQTVFVSIRNRVQMISVFIPNCKCLSEHLNGFRWEFSIPAPPLSKGVYKAFLLPKFPNTDFCCSGSPPSKFSYRFQASGCFAWSVFHAGFLCHWSVAVFQNSCTSACTATRRGEISADLLACQLKRSTRILPAWLR